jgi:hypothetical protein
MSRSFFGRTDHDLYMGSGSFAVKINASPESYGLSALQAAEYQALSDIYRACYVVAIAPGTRTVGTVSAKNDAREKLRVAAGNLARIIRGTSSVTDAEKIALGLSVPGSHVAAAGAAVDSLGTPTRFSVTLDGIGGLILKWKCTNPRATGTVYQISRSIQPPVGTGRFTFLGISRKRKFIDSTVPAGASEMNYQIQAVRSTAVGPVATFNVMFGVGAGRQLPASMALAA